ncbi:MAG: TRAP transporter small permease [Gammaproteobacteria bacterium]
MNSIIGGWLERADQWGRFLENALMTLLLSGLILLASTQILLRNVFSTGLGWGDGVVRLMVLWLALLGAVAASRENKQIKIDLLTRSLSGVPQKIAQFLTDVFTVTITSLLAWHSWRFVQDSRLYGDVLVADWPAWIFQLILPVGFALLAYRSVLQTFRNLLGERS